jgi:hypothetical protein
MSYPKNIFTIYETRNLVNFEFFFRLKLKNWKGSKRAKVLLLLKHVVRGTLLVAQLVGALRYKPEGRGFDWNFSLT